MQVEIKRLVSAKISFSSSQDSSVRNEFVWAPIGPKSQDFGDKYLLSMKYNFVVVHKNLDIFACWNVGQSFNQVISFTSSQLQK